jgi:uncharacterized protein (TIGR03437 family)
MVFAARRPAAAPVPGCSIGTVEYRLSRHIAKGVSAPSPHGCESRQQAQAGFLPMLALYHQKDRRFPRTPQANPMRLSKIIAGCASMVALAQVAAAQTPYNSLVSRILGQAVLQRSLLTAIAPNLAEGRELYNPQSVALDTSVSPNILYVADTGNNRVLAWKNAATFSSGSFADMVLGQPDKYSTSIQGPSAGGGSAVSYYFNSPVAVAVDSKGNLYVADAGNNRVLRFPKPFSQGSGINPPDLVIGQTSLNSSAANQGLPAPTAKTIVLSRGTAFRSGMALDGQGNLWLSDAGNNRVLRYPVSALGSSPANGPAADLVLGQSNFTGSTVPAGSTSDKKNFLSQPTFLAFDPSGRLYVSDNALRVVVYQNPFSTGQPAVRIMGVVPQSSGAVSAQSLGFGGVPPQGIFFAGASPWVVDAPSNRILGYPPFEQWPPETTSFSPPATSVIGQPDFVSFQPNQGNAQPSSATLSFPVGAAFNGTDLFVADSGNHRVLDFPFSGGTFTTATHVLGQTGFEYNAPNLVEGREFNFFNSTLQLNGGGVAVDNASSPPHLYVADPGNNRVLAFNDFRTVVAGQKADLVIGQPDFLHSLVNYPTNSPDTPSSSSLFAPTAVTVDSNGDLWVADAGNGRVLRFPSPFQQTGGDMQQANLVIGQLNFTQSLHGVTAQTMGAPSGIAFSKNGGLLVSDVAFNRVLYFRKQGSGFITGQSASVVIGQSDFGSRSANSASVAAGGLSSPRGIAVDSSDTLYVADSGNGRIAMFNNVSSISSGPATSLALGGMSSPQGVVINSKTQEIWVADTLNNRLLRYQNYNSVLQGNTTPTAQIPDFVPFGMALDSNGNPVVTESGANRVSFYYPVMYVRNAANYFVRYAPGMLATLFPAAGMTFGPTKASAGTLPIPTTLGDVQVLVNGVAAPIFYASPTQINFQVPMKTPTSQQEVQVVRVSTDQVLADSFVTFSPAAPGLFTTNGSGNSQVSAINADDNTPNGINNPVKAGHVISLYGTGQGFIANAPPDGQVPSGAIPTPIVPQVYPNATLSPKVSYSGLAPCCVGLWQINVEVPSNAAPGADPILVIYNGANSVNDGSGATGIDSSGIQHSVITTIYVKQ